MKLKPIDLLLAAALAVLILPRLNLSDGGTPVPTIPEPSAELKALCEPVTAKLKGHAQAGELAAFYAAYADILKRDAAEKVVKTTARLRTHNQRSVKLRFQGAFSKVPGLASAIDAVLMGHLGPKVADLDYARAGEAMLALAWAAQEAK
jgi:hypothetical protein